MGAKAAKIRAEVAMSAGELPEIRDIKEILRAQRLAGRKGLIVQILKERFGRFGKCVPVSSGGQGGEHNVPMEFVTNCSVERLGSFLLEQYENLQ